MQEALDWTEQTFLLSGTSSTYQIAFEHTDNYGYGVGIDDITIGAPPSCLPVTGLNVSALDTTSLTFVWTDADNSGTTYTISYWADSGDTTEVGGISATTYTLTGLTPNTFYNISVTANCSATEASTPAFLRTKTACGGIAVPFAEGFEGSTVGQAPDCWMLVSTAGVSEMNYYTYDYETTQYPIVQNNGHNNSSKSLLFKAESNNDTIVIASPAAIPLAGNGIYVSFWSNAYEYSFYGSLTFEAGVVTSPTDRSSFVPLLTVTDRSNIYVLHEFTTASLDAAASYYVAFRYVSPSSYGYVRLDDITIREDNGCNRPAMAWIDSVAPYSANLRWSNAGGATTAYDLFYSTTNSLDGAQVVSGLTDTSYTLAGLTPQTTYYAWVRTACGSDSADAKAIGSFTTQLTCASVVNVAVGETSYTAVQVNWDYDNNQGFASQGAMLTLTNLSDSTEAPVVVTVDEETTSYIFTDLQPSSSYAIAITNTCNTGSQVDSAAVVTVATMTQSCATIDGGSESTSTYVNPFNANYNYGYSQNLYTREEMPSIDTIHGIAFKALSNYGSPITIDVYLANTAQTSLANGLVPYSSLVRVATNYSYSISEGWNVITFDSAFVYDGVGSLVVAVDNNTGDYDGNLYWMHHPTENAQSASNYSDGTNYNPATVTSLGSPVNYALDIQFVAACEIPTCFAPLGLTVTDSDTATISVSWSTSGTESSFVLGYMGSSDSTYTYLTAVSDTFYTFTNLDVATTYSLRVGSICGADTLWSRLTATTSCGTIAISNDSPYAENFDAYAEEVLPPCWDYDPSSITHFDGGLFWRSSRGGDIAVLPTLGAPLNDLEVTFKAKMGTPAQGDRWVIGAANSQGQLLEWIDTTPINPNQSRSDFVWFTVRLNNYTGNGTRIAITHTYTGSDWSLLDDLTVRYIPQCLPVAGLAGHNLIHADSMYFSWSNPGGAGSFDVAYDTL